MNKIYLQEENSEKIEFIRRKKNESLKIALNQSINKKKSTPVVSLFDNNVNKNNRKEPVLNNDMYFSETSDGDTLTYPELKENLVSAKNIVSDIIEDNDNIKDIKSELSEKEVFQENIIYNDDLENNDVIELSKIAYYSEILTVLNNSKVDIDDKKVRFVDLIEKEFLRLLKKEQNLVLLNLFERSNNDRKYTNVYEYLHTTAIFLNYIKMQTDLYLKERPLREKSLNWKKLYIANIDNKAWLEDIEYADKANETITPRTKTGIFIWGISILLSILGVYVNAQNDSNNLLNMFFPLIIILSILIIVSIFDYLFNLIIKMKYQRLKKDLISLKEAINEINLSKREINPLMFDICFNHIKNKNK